MSIWNKVLVGLIGVSALVLFYMAARALNTQLYWSNLAAKHEQRIHDLKEQIRVLAQETAAGQLELHKLLVDRRRVWPECDAIVKTGTGTAEVSLTVNQVDDKGQPLPHGIASGTVLYAFEKEPAEKKGQYLGEFKVTSVGAKQQVTLVPTAVLSDREVNKIKKANRRPWMLYEIMPSDNHEVFASLSDAEKKAMLPADSLRAFLKDGKPAEKDDPKEDVVDGLYVRRLLDYNVLFNNERDARMLLENSIAAAKYDKTLVQAALAEARTQADACARDFAAAKAEKERLEHERDIVGALSQKLDKTLGDMEAWIARLTQTNQAMAGRIAKLQLDAAKKIDQRTRDMAQSGAGRL